MIKDYKCTTSFLDLLFNMILAFIALFILAFASMNVQKNSKNAESKAEFLITLTWASGNNDDVDLYVEDPQGKLVWFRQKENGLMHLDRDDIGTYNDQVMTEFGPVTYVENREIVSIRQIIPGEFIVNCHMFAKRDPEPVEVTVQVDKLNPFSTIAIKKQILSMHGEEKTLLRFSVNDKGDVIDVNELEKLFTHSIQLPTTGNFPQHRPPEGTEYEY